MGSPCTLTWQLGSGHESEACPNYYAYASDILISALLHLLMMLLSRCLALGSHTRLWLAGLRAGGAGLQLPGAWRDGEPSSDLGHLLQKCRVPFEVCSPFAALSGMSAVVFSIPLLIACIGCKPSLSSLFAPFRMARTTRSVCDMPSAKYACLCTSSQSTCDCWQAEVTSLKQ